jgi:RNA polymerase sigma factor (sigma-70 family)
MADEPDDRQLLAAYARRSEQDAFAQLVRRHVGFVYGCALRQTHDPPTAEDVTQTVFTLLAREARAVSRRRGPLRGWLFAVARYAASNELRAAARRRRHERRAARPEAWHPEDHTGEHSHAREVPGLLDAALASLSRADREAVLLRYFGGLDARDVAAALGVSEPAARRRLSRAVERMRRYLAAGGVAMTAATFPAALAPPPEPPAGLVQRIISDAAAPSAARLRQVRAVARRMAARAASLAVAPLLVAVLCLTGAGMLVKASARAPANPTAAVVAPPVLPRRPLLRLTFAWGGQGLTVPMPATFPEELRGTEDFRRWVTSGGEHTFTWVTRDGRTYRCSAREVDVNGRRVSSIALVQRLRADGTLETETVCDDEGAPRQWTVFAADGKSKLASYSNCLKGTPGEPFVQSLRVYDAGGAVREYEADRNGTAYVEWLLDGRGNRLRLLNGAG